MGDTPEHATPASSSTAAASEPSASAHTERRVLLGTLAAELGHDLQGALNLFRLTAERLERGASFDAEDIALLREELARMSAISGRLRSLSRATLERRVVTVQSLTAQALEWVRHPRRDALALSIPAEAGLRCDPGLLALALAELVRNALSAMRTAAGIVWQDGKLTVWDDGPGFELTLEQALVWGSGSRPGATGIGLTVAWRAARAHGFGLTMARAAEKTLVSLSVPAQELGGAQGKLGA